MPKQRTAEEWREYQRARRAKLRDEQSEAVTPGVPPTESVTPGALAGVTPVTPNPEISGVTGVVVTPGETPGARLIEASSEYLSASPDNLSVREDFVWPPAIDLTDRWAIRDRLDSVPEGLC